MEGKKTEEVVETTKKTVEATDQKVVSEEKPKKTPKKRTPKKAKKEEVIKVSLGSIEGHKVTDIAKNGGYYDVQAENGCTYRITKEEAVSRGVNI